MNTARLLDRVPQVTAFVLVVAASASALTLPRSKSPAPMQSSADMAREAIEALYDDWSHARVELDRETLGALLAPGSVVSLRSGQEIDRDSFLAMVTQSSGARLTRFDVDVLTVQQSEDGWTAVITEKLESERTAPDGTTRTDFSFWVTRDTCREDEDGWRLTGSEEISHENWRGSPPPIANW